MNGVQPLVVLSLSLAQKVVAEEPTSMRIVPPLPLIREFGPLDVELMEKLGKVLRASVIC